MTNLVTARSSAGFRERMLRRALFASTALVGVTLAAPAIAQTANPAGGGTVTTTNGTITGGGANEGVLVQQRGAGGVEVTGVSITNTGATPTVDGLRVVGAGGRGVGISIVTTSTVTSQSGDGVRLQGGSGENVGFGVLAGQTLNVTGINGVNITSTGGLFLSNPGDAGAIVATARNTSNGAGVRIATGAGFGGSLGNVTATNFATGIDLSGNGVGATIEGGSITGANDGIRANSTANIILDSRATIEGVNGIYATAANGASVTTSGTGTINARFSAIGAGITAISSGGAGAVTVNSGQAIGNALAGYYGIDAQTQGTSTGAIAITTTGTIHGTDRGISAVSVGGPTTITAGAAIVGGTNGIYAAGANGTTVTTNAGGTIDGETAGNGIGINVSGSGATQITQGAAIGGTTSFNRGIVAAATGTGTVNVTSNAAITTTGTNARGIAVTTTNAAATVATNAAISTPGNGVTVASGTGVSTVTVGGAITISGTSGTGVEAIQVGAASVVNVNANITGGNRAVSGKGTTNVATGVTVSSNIFGIDQTSGGTVNNSGSIASNYRTVAFINGTLNNLEGGTITSTGSFSAGGAAIVGTGTFNNAGAIAGNGGGDGVLSQGVTRLNNTTGGTVTGTRGVYHSSGSTLTIGNTGGTITGVQNGVVVQGGGALVLINTGTIQTAGGIGGGGASAIYLDSASATPHSVTNSGTLLGGITGVAIDTGALTLVNQSGGTISGGTNALLLSTTGATNVTLNQGSTVTGAILSEDTGARTMLVSGALNGAYNGGTGTGVVTWTLGSTGAMQAATFGNANDTFLYQGGTIGGLVDAGAGGDIFNSTLGATGTGTVSLANLTGFEAYNQNSGTLTLTGARTGGPGWNLVGGTLNFGVDANTPASLITPGVAIAPTAGTILNVRAGSLIRSTADVTIANANGAFTINNAGTIDGTSGNTIQNGNTALTLNNLTGGVISTTNFVATLVGANSRITNAGTITGGSSVDFGYGIEANGLGTQIVNQNGGIIQSAATNPVRFDNGGTLTNQLGGTIRHTGTASSARGAGVYSAGDLTLVNGGQITTTSTGASDGVTVIGVGNITNTGTRVNGALTGGLIQASTASGIAITATGSTVTNSGEIRGGTSTSFGDGIAYVGGTITNQAGGIVTGGLYGVSATGTGLATITNAGVIAGGSAGIDAVTAAIANSGTIGTGTVSGAGAFTVGGAGFAIRIGSGSVVNTGTINSTGASVFQTSTTGTLNLVNSGTIGGAGQVVDPDDTVVANGAATILNGGTITAANFYGVVMNRGGTLTNAAGGLISAGPAENNRSGVVASGAPVTIGNYATIRSTGTTNLAIATDNNAATINLFAGSNTGAIQTGTGNDTLALYTGRGTAGTATVDAASGITLQNAGTLAAAQTTTINLGGGTNTVQLRGTGDGTTANGTAGTYMLGSTATGVGQIAKADTGTWTLTGNGAGVARIDAGLTPVPGSGGLLIFDAPTNLAAAIYVNGGIIRATTTGAFGTGTIHAVDPTIQFAAGGTNTNNYVLDVAAPASADPTTFESVGANAIALNGSITTGTGNNINGAAIAPNQFVTFAGTNGSSFTLGNAANAWTGDTTINTGITLTGSVATISGGRVVDNGTLIFDQPFTGTFARVISGTGALVKQGAGTLILTAANTYTGTTTVNGGLLQLGNGTTNGTLASNAIVLGGGSVRFNEASAVTYNGNISGVGGVQVVGTGPLTLGGALTQTGGFDIGSGALPSTNAILTGSYTAPIRINLNAGSLTNLGTITVTNGGANDVTLYDGVRVIANGTVVNGSLANTTAAIRAANTGVVVVSTTPTTVTNYGVVTGTNYAGIGQFNNAGNITIDNLNGTAAGTGGVIYGRGLVNFGWGVYNGVGGTLTVTNESAATIVGAIYGAYGVGGSTITNAGRIASGSYDEATRVITAGGTAGIRFDAAGTVDNQLGGLVTGATGISSGGALTLTNRGTITGTVGSGIVFAGANSSIGNTGTITGGTSAATGYGVQAAAGAAGTITNTGGRIQGTTGGILRASTGDVAITNSGVLSGTGTTSYGINATGGTGTITNTTGGIIAGRSNGILSSVAATIVNTGTIGTGTVSAGANPTFTAGGAGTAIQIAGGSVTNNAGGTIQAGTGIAIAFTGGIASVTNGGTIAGGSTGISAGAGVTATSITNTGRIASQTGSVVVVSGGTLTLENQAGGVVAASGTNGATAIAFTGSSANITNRAGATIDGSTGGNAISASGLLTLLNEGAIATTNTLYTAVFATGIADVTNTGTISGGYDGVRTNGAASIVRNSGTIAATQFAGVRMFAGGTVENSGTVTGLDGIEVGGAAGTVTNSGTITARNNGINLLRGGTATNTATGTINARTVPGGWGLYSTGVTATLANAGTINADSGFAIFAGGTATNTGTINATANGLLTGGTAAVTLTNAGTISAIAAQGRDGIGAQFTGAGTLVNTGTIAGGTGGVLGTGGALAIDNAGSLTGGTYAIRSTGAFADTVVLRDGSTTSGLVDLGDGADTLTLFAGATGSGLLDGGAGTDAFVLDGTGTGTLDAGRVVNFESRTKQGTGTVTLTGIDTGTTTWTIDAGTLNVDGGSAINDGAGVVVNANGTLGLLANEAIATLNGSGAVTLGANTLTLAGNGDSAFSGVISGQMGGIEKLGTGTLTLSGANTYSGTTAVRAGTLLFGADNILADDSTLDIYTGATVDLAGHSDTIGLLGLRGGTLTGGGTLTATAYGLYGGTVNQALGGGTLIQIENTTILNGTSDASSVIVRGGTLQLGASERLRDDATLGIESLGTLDLVGFDETVGTAGIAGTLNGTGTLTATTYTLANATVNANLGTGTLTQGSGVSTLNGTSAAGIVNVNAGTLVLGAAERLSNGAALGIASGAQLTLNGAETVGTASIAGTLGGTGTLTAATYTLNGATVNANLGTGVLTQASGTSTLNGTAAATAVQVQAGTLVLGAADRLADTAMVGVASGAALNLGGNDTVGTLQLNGTLGGTGTLTAASYALNGATVNANLGTGVLFQQGGTSTLNGTSNAGQVSIDAGTLVLGASERLADTTNLTIGNSGPGAQAGGTLDIGAFTETVGSAAIYGTLAGTGTLNAARYELDGGTVNANLGGGTLVVTPFNARASVLNGTAAANSIQIQGGTLRLGASDRLSDTASVTVGDNSFVAGPGVLDIGAFNDTVGSLSVVRSRVDGTGTLTAASYTLNAATVNANLGTGTLVQTAGTSTLNGTAAATTVTVAGGTLALGADNRLADTAAVSVSTGTTLDIVNHSDTIGSLFVGGTLNGTGTLTASGVGANGAGYTLNGATVNANLGTGSLRVVQGVSTLNGTAAAGTVQITSGTLTLGASNRLADAAAVSVSTGATLNIGAFNDTVGTLGLSGTLAGTGTLTATSYTLNGAAVNANLGTGTLTQASGTSTLNGAAAAGTVNVAGGTLALGASNRLADAAAVSVSTGATLNIGTFNDTVGTLGLSGTLAGTGTLTATSYALNGATVNANLGTGTLTQASGTSALNGTAAAGTVNVNAGTLTLGASDRLADTAAVAVASGATLNLGAFNDTVGTLGLSGTLAGTGTLTATSYTLNGAVVNANLGTGTLTQASGTSTLNGTAAAGTVNVTGGTLALGASNRLADAAAVSVSTGATLNIAAFNDTVGTLGLSGTLAGTGTLTATSYTLNGAAVNANLGTGTLAQASGTSTLNGTAAAGTVAVTGGTLTLGADNRLADAAAVSVSTGATLNIAAFNDTVGTLGLSGTLAGTGTLTATSYTLNGASVNANLGGGTLTQASGTSVLNGSAAATTVNVNAGTLTLGAANRLADAAAVAVATGATLNLGAFNDTVGTASLGGTLAGTGTLTAATYTLNGATVNANLGAGTLTQASGTSTLNGTAAAATVAVTGGTLTLGASDRLLDTAALSLASGATLNLGAFNDTVGTASLAGTLAGTGTLTAATYTLNGATVNANLGAGTLTQGSGTSTLTGSSAATTVNVNAGTLVLGASDRLANAASVAVATGATLNLGAFSDTVGTASLAGTLAGTGTLTAATYTLNAASVNANLGAGVLTQASGVSVLTGTSAATTVAVNGGTLRLGADERLANTAGVTVAAGATFDLAGRTETIGTLTGTGAVAVGAGRLVAGGTNADFTFGGTLSGTGDFDKVGTGTLALSGNQALTGRINLLAGTTAFSGSTAGALRIQGGTLTGGGTVGGNLLLASGTLNPGTATQPIGGVQANSLTVTGGTAAFDLAGSAGAFASDTLRVTGAAALSGGTVVTRATEATANYNLTQTYTLVQAGSVTGTFANGTGFTQTANNADLFWRLRYDLSPNAVLLELRKQIDFTGNLGAGASGNQLAVGAALNGGALIASDDFANTLNTIANLTPAQRQATFDSIGGEAIGDITSGVGMLGDRFTTLLRQRLAIGGASGQGSSDAGNGSGSGLMAGLLGGRQGLEQLRGAAPTTGASSLSGGTGNRGAVWLQAFGSEGRIDGRNGAADVNTHFAGAAGGVEANLGVVTVGAAFAGTKLETDVRTRASSSDGTVYQGGGYVAYDDGKAYASLIGSYFQGDIDSIRNVSVGTTAIGQARGETEVRGYTAGAAVGYRFALSPGLRFTPQASVQALRVTRDAFTERGIGGLSLGVARERRELYTAIGEGRLSYVFETPGGAVEPYVGGGASFNFGDLDTASAMRFTGAPTGTGAFTINGARLAPVTGLFNGGLEVRPNDRVAFGMGVESSLSNRQREGRISARIRVGF